MSLPRLAEFGYLAKCQTQPDKSGPTLVEKVIEIFKEIFKAVTLTTLKCYTDLFIHHRLKYIYIEVDFLHIVFNTLLAIFLQCRFLLESSIEIDFFDGEIRYFL